jgi:hypothetical protein
LEKRHDGKGKAKIVDAPLSQSGNSFSVTFAMAANALARRLVVNTAPVHEEN